MAGVGEILAAEIASQGPVRFDRFMELALYHPTLGYYTSARERFGKEGDFYTAEQVQPSFGILIRALLRQFRREMGDPMGFTVVELGAGRREMGAVFESEFSYVPVDVGYGALPQRFTGVVFSNEFFDALPVRVFERRGATWYELRVDFREDNFSWVLAEPADDDSMALLDGSPLAEEEGARQEICLAAREWLARIDAALVRGVFLAIDYGYTTPELRSFPAGTLMGYQRHQALSEVLRQPGLRDITSHVNFSSLAAGAAALGWRVERIEMMSSLLLRAGEPDQFREVLESGLEVAGETTRLQRRLQLKTLLFGMGETFRTMTARKD